MFRFQLLLALSTLRISLPVGAVQLLQFIFQLPLPMSVTAVQLLRFIFQLLFALSVTAVRLLRFIFAVGAKHSSHSSSSWRPTIASIHLPVGAVQLLEFFPLPLASSLIPDSREILARQIAPVPPMIPHQVASFLEFLYPLALLSSFNCCTRWRCCLLQALLELLYVLALPSCLNSCCRWRRCWHRTVASIHLPVAVGGTRSSNSSSSCRWRSP
jgi:hypothetical protein